MYISEKKLNYNKKSDFCIYSTVFDEKKYFCLLKCKWIKCPSPFCNIHGQENRKELAKKISKNFKGFGQFANISIHFGEKTTLKQQDIFIKEFQRLVYYHYSNIHIQNFQHWEFGKYSRREKFRHFHLIIGSQEAILKKTLKAYEGKAKKKAKIPTKTRIRLGFKQDATPDFYIQYCCRTGINKKKLVYPPPEMKWILCRINKSPEQKAWRKEQKKLGKKYYTWKQENPESTLSGVEIPDFEHPEPDFQHPKMRPESLRIDFQHEIDSRAVELAHRGLNDDLAHPDP